MPAADRRCSRVLVGARGRGATVAQPRGSARAHALERSGHVHAPLLASLTSTRDRAPPPGAGGTRGGLAAVARGGDAHSSFGLNRGALSEGMTVVDVNRRRTGSTSEPAAHGNEIRPVRRRDARGALAAALQAQLPVDAVAGPMLLSRQARGRRSASSRSCRTSGHTPAPTAPTPSGYASSRAGSTATITADRTAASAVPYQPRAS